MLEKSAGKVQVGDLAPDFTLNDANGIPVSLHDLLGKNEIILFFYPKDNTPVCTAEACAFRDSYEEFQKLGAEVVGISSDNSVSHRSFAALHRLPFLLLSDPGNVVRKRYGAASVFGLLPGRVTYLIDREGIVQHVFSSAFNAAQHVAEMKQVLESLRANAPR